MRLLALILLVTSCSLLKPSVSKPATTTVQTDAGTRVCEYVKFEVDSKEADVAVCAKSDADLQLAVAAVKAAYPLAEEYLP